jgi:AcrR family transcriptional regulator
MVKPSSKLRERIREATTEVVLEAAESVFAEEGLHLAKVETIAALAGVSVGTLYNHFGDRNGLVTALIDARRQQLLALLDACLERTSGQPFRAQVRAFVDVLVTHFATHAPFFSILMDAEHGREGGGPNVKPRAAMKAIYLRCTTLVSRGLASGEMPALVGDFGPVLLMGTVRAVFVRALLAKKELPPDAAAVATGFFLRGVGVADV